MARSHCLLVVLLTVVLTIASCQDTELPVGGEPVERVVREKTVSLSYQVNRDQPVRISINSSQVDLSHRLLVAVRHGGRIISWTLPYVEAGHAYSQVQRTLCSEVSSHKLLIDVSSYNSNGSISRNISFTISVFYISDYQLKLGSSNSVLVAPPSPVVYVFDFADHPGVDHFFVKVTSRDQQGSTICSITSVQDGLCPVDQILDNPEHRGTFQTMLQLSAINIRRPRVGSKVYVVLSVLPTDSECLGSSRDLIDGLVMVNLSANYRPIFNNSISDRVKNITITIESALPAFKYWIAAVVLVIVFALFYILTILWILVADYILYDQNPAHKLIQMIDEEIERKQERQEEEVENVGQEEVDISETVIGRRHKRSKRRRRQSSTRSGTGRLVKRPSLLSVLGGRQWSDELEKITPACSQQQDIAGRFTQALRHQNEPEPVPITHPPVYSTTQSLPVGIITAASQPDRRVPSDPGLNATTSSTSVLDTTSSSTSDVDMRVTTPERQSNSGEVVLTKTTSWHSHRRTNSMETAIQENSIENIALQTGNGRIPTLVLPADDPGLSASEAESPQETHSLTISSPVKVVVTELNILRLPKTLDQLSFAEGRQFQQKYRGYWTFVSTITLFYAIPAFQLVLTYQKFLNQSGNEDLCYYNTLCSRPLGIMSSFNNIWSNIGFVFLGFLYITVAYRRRQTYRFYETVNEGYEANGREKVGVPQHFGIYYAMGVALVGEGFLSAAYHICPSSNNYQFDTTMMFVLIGLGLYKLYECRNPDNVPHTHWLLFILSLLILLIGVGVLYPGNLGFYIVFFIIFECAVVVFSIENYYRWKLNFWKIGNIKVLLSEVRTIVKHPWPPQHKGKFAYAILSNVVNFFFALSCVIYQPEDFATFFLYIMIGNFVLSLAYYAIMKLCFREYRHDQILHSLLPLILFVISIPFWAAGIAMYASYVTNWLHPIVFPGVYYLYFWKLLIVTYCSDKLLESPSTSRNSNADCVLFEFYDTHDLWHCFTAFAMFFSFLMLMTLDDDQEYRGRKKLHLF